jgi:hypothetical protein
MENKTYESGASMKLKQRIFDLMNGSLNIEEFPVEESRYVQNEFSDGRAVSQLYSRAYNLKLKLYDRLGSEDDADVEHLMDTLLELGEVISMKMFDYGWFFSRQIDKPSM